MERGRRGRRRRGGRPGTSQDTLDTAISSAITTIGGNRDLPIQMLEQSPQGAHIDWGAFSTMEARYSYQLESQLFTGTGASSPQSSGNNQLPGIFNNAAIPAANQIAFTNGDVSAEASPGTPAQRRTCSASSGWRSLRLGRTGSFRRRPR